ncbi:MAG: hypothetical protein ACI9ZH_000070 [Paracoccaceae bacterium]|jgi:hypothetical protein
MPHAPDRHPADPQADPYAARGLRNAREIEDHLGWLETITPLALGILAAASGIYTYLGVSGLLEGQGPLSFFAALAYSLAVSVAIFVFWSYVMRILPAMTWAGGIIGMTLATLLGCCAIVAMSSWLNAAALAGSAAVEQHLARTMQDYQAAVERAHSNAVAGQALARDVARARTTFEDLSELERAGNLSGVGGQGAVYRLLRQKSEELAALEQQIGAQDEPIAAAFERGNEILNRMRGLIAAQGPVKLRSVGFAEQSVRLAGVVATLRQLSVAPLVARAAQDLRASVVMPVADGATGDVRAAQASTMASVLGALDQRAKGLAEAAQNVINLPEPIETTYAPISTADAVIRYGGDFIPAWAGAISIDLLPLVLVFIVATSQAAIRRGRGDLAYERGLSVADLQAALVAMRSLEGAMGAADKAMTGRTGDPGPDTRPDAGPDAGQSLRRDA